MCALYNAPKHVPAHKLAGQSIGLLLTAEDQLISLSATALYRALLRQSRAAPIAEDERNILQIVLRNKFRHNRNLQSWRLLRLAFTAGYEVCAMPNRGLHRLKSLATLQTHANGLSIGC